MRLWTRHPRKLLSKPVDYQSIPNYFTYDCYKFVTNSYTTTTIKFTNIRHLGILADMSGVNIPCSLKSAV